MTGHAANGQKVFGKRKDPHRVIIARGDHVRSFTISPWIAGAATAIGLMLAVGYVGATAYLVLRDDIIHSSSERQAQMQLSYEDRIASLRARIDQLTSRSVLERQSLETQLEGVLTRQQDLDTRQSRVAALLQKAADSGIRVAVGGPIPQTKPDVADPLLALDAELTGTGIGGTPEPIEIGPDLNLRGSQSETLAPSVGRPAASPKDQAALDGKKTLIESVAGNLQRMDREAHLALDVIAVSAEQDAKRISETADKLGLQLAGATPPQDPAESGSGGPYVALGATDFDARLHRAERALIVLDTLKTAARGIPFDRPVAGAPISSSFGPRLDPFLGRMAMHTGTDFKAPRGANIRAPGPGTVVFAGRNGGYGKSVEIEHPSGVVTRFAHMSRILVKKGQTVAARAPIGRVGSTGRSTGPHLHYEVRMDDRPMNPTRFMDAGERIKPLLEN
ncbi:peptidoglycan DD-metalloendopeptidase family protein [Stappia sp. ES.058]|uniref:peptidoglycan DD-metalloendopeptidase family protein n=1 Tax=Stappia sp. ES.058 TaxID=1881061 RepID=UPI00087AA2AC|nr:peptidoglycan DD-metalloendopeptidase family protein [Stappia sp. ES.058]SDU17247.1 Peptidase family M23 [Stappia sp. ES.058]